MLMVVGSPASSECFRTIYSERRSLCKGALAGQILTVPITAYPRVYSVAKGVNKLQDIDASMFEHTCADAGTSRLDPVYGLQKLSRVVVCYASVLPHHTWGPTESHLGSPSVAIHQSGYRVDELLDAVDDRGECFSRH
jgi:hypothetical protein